MTDVVYIDDEPALCRIFERLLTRAGIETRTFTDPLEGLQYINEHPPQVVLCDQRMPTISGTALFEALEVDVRFVLISGDLTAADAAPKGMVAVLPKPVSPETLIETVKGLLRR